MLDKQVNLFSVNTDAFLFDDERTIKQETQKKNSAISDKINKIHNEILKLSKNKDYDYVSIRLYKENAISNLTKKLNTRKRKSSKKIKKMLDGDKHNGDIRELNRRYLKYFDVKENIEKDNINNIISMFESDLTRNFGIKKDELTDKIIVVEAWYYQILKDLIINGFVYDNRKYIYFSSSAGQIRTKKAVFVEEETYEKVKLTLTCGLTIDKINELGGMNVNKYLAYLALCNSATEHWDDIFDNKFDIDKCIVVDDFETNVKGKADYINCETYEIQNNKDSEFTIGHMDGCGIILNSYVNTNFMIRLPFVKGLLTPFNYLKFIEINGCSPIVKDLWGKTYNIIEDDIKVIFSKSQLKMYKYYSSWDEYKDNFKKYNCNACVCNVEESHIKNATINYQMLQSLYNMTDEEAEDICKSSNSKIKNISCSLNNMLEIFGVKQNRELLNNNYFNKALKIYPELLKDTSNKETLRDLKNSLIKKYKSGRLEVQGKFTFVIPDVYAFCEWLFMDIKTPKGLLEKDEVFCKLYKNYDRLDCLRSPSLFLEHALRNNVCNKKYRNQRLNEWFTTNGIYTSSHDLISRMLQLDVDGDKLLVVSQKNIIEMAEKRMKNINPLYYDMKKANAVILNNEAMYDGLNLAFSGGKIGQISNDITKLWNNELITDEEKTIIKFLCAETNYTIDFAKTLYKPNRPTNIDILIKKHTKHKVPYFFQFAKDKKEKNCEKLNNSTMNKICKQIDDSRISFLVIRPMAKLDYKKLIDKKYIVEDERILDLYNSLNKSYGNKVKVLNSRKINETPLLDYLYDRVNELGYSNEQIANTLAKSLYKKQTSTKKNLFWIMYGDIIYNNLENNLKDAKKYCLKCGARVSDDKLKNHLCEKCRGKSEYKIVKCQDCGVEFEVSKKNNSKVRCDDCQKKFRLENVKKNMEKMRKTKMLSSEN